MVMVLMIALAFVFLDIDPSMVFVKISMNVLTTMKTDATTTQPVSILLVVTPVNVTKVTKVMEYGVFPLVNAAKQDLTVLRMLTVLRGQVINGHVFVLMDMKVMDTRVKTLTNAPLMLIHVISLLDYARTVFHIINVLVKRVMTL